MHRSAHQILCLALVFAAFLFSSPLFAAEPAATPRAMIDAAQRIVFLGDSITASGQYVTWFDTWLATQKRESPATVINMGLASETVSGLSEEGHAGGQFPRPDLHERLARVLATAKPDLVIACYGMNCGIYEPLNDERFEKYQQGWKKLKEQVEQSGAKIIAVTPPFYDDQRSPKTGFSYNEVLDRYSDWLLDQRKNGWVVIDLHGPMTAAVKKQREDDPKFTFQPDGVHPNEAGHWFVAQQLIAACGDAKAAAAESPEKMLEVLDVSAPLLPLIGSRMTLLRDAYVSSAGHKRPGVAAGVSLEEATARAQDLGAKIEQVLKK